MLETNFYKKNTKMLETDFYKIFTKISATTFRLKRVQCDIRESHSQVGEFFGKFGDIWEDHSSKILSATLARKNSIIHKNKQSGSLCT